MLPSQRWLVRRIPVAAVLLLCTFLVPKGDAAHWTPHDDGGVHGSSQLSDLTALMSIISGMRGTDPSWSRFSNVCDWKGVACDVVGNVQIVVWNTYNLVGLLNLTVVPQFVQYMDFSSNSLAGPALDWSALPATLTHLDLSNNAFNATLGFQNLPSNLQTLNLAYNQFTGSPSLASLPSSLTLGLMNNLFCGDIAVANISSLVYGNMCIGSLNPTWNATSSILSCPVCSADPHEEDLVAMLSFVSGFNSGRDPSWTAATPACSWVGVSCVNTIVTEISFLYLSLSGILNMTLMPRFTQFVGVQGSFVAGASIVGWTALSAYPLVEIQLSGNGFVGEIDFLHVPASVLELYVSNNNFTGTPNLSLLPATLNQLDISHNDFCGIIKATNATYNADNVDRLCLGGISASWVPELPAYVCPPCSS